MRTIRRDSLLLAGFRTALMNDKLRIGSGVALGLITYYLAVERARPTAHSADAGATGA